MYLIGFFVGACVLALIAAICFTCAAVFLVKTGKEALELMAQAMTRANPNPEAVKPAEAPVAAPQPLSTDGCSGCKSCKMAHAKPEDKFEQIDGRVVRSADYETRADGLRVRKDRWEVGMRNIAGMLTGPRAGFEIDEVVEKIRVIVQAARADYESGGNGVPGSAPVWGPCPANCDHGTVIVEGTDADCPTCEGRGKVVVEEPTVKVEETQ